MAPSARPEKCCARCPSYPCWEVPDDRRILCACGHPDLYAPGWICRHSPEGCTFEAADKDPT